MSYSLVHVHVLCTPHELTRPCRAFELLSANAPDIHTLHAMLRSARTRARRVRKNEVQNESNLITWGMLYVIILLFCPFFTHLHDGVAAPTRRFRQYGCFGTGAGHGRLAAGTHNILRRPSDGVGLNSAA